MRRTLVSAFLIFFLFPVATQATAYSILNGTVTEVHSRYLVIKSDDAGIIHLRIGKRTVYPVRLPVVEDRVTVEYLISRGIYIGYSVTVLEGGTKEEIGPQRLGVEGQAKFFPQDQTKDLLGLWKGILPGKSEIRLMEILAIEKVDDRRMEGKANHGMANRSMNLTQLTLRSEKVGTLQVSFSTPAQNKVVLKKESGNRLEGTFETKDGKRRMIRYWKEGVIPDIDPRLKNYLGTWEGKWSQTASTEPFNAKVTIAYIDTEAASVLYERATIRETYNDPATGKPNQREHKATWNWNHATVTSKGSIQYPSLDGKRIFTFELSPDQKRVIGEEKGALSSNLNFNRKIELNRVK